MPSSSAIKQKAKEFLKNNFSAAFAVGFLALAVQALLLVFTGFIATLCNATVGQTVATVIAAVFGAAAVLFLYLPILLGGGALVLVFNRRQQCSPGRGAALLLPHR